MKPNVADNLNLTNFEQITKIKVQINYLPMGEFHKPSSLQDGWQGVYVFLIDDCCFKVGKAGPKSKARWNSHHYNLDKTTPSTFSKSIMKHIDEFKKYFIEELHLEISLLDKKSIKSWIKNNISRIELIIPEQNDDFALNLLEALVQYQLKPIYEGKNA